LIKEIIESVARVYGWHNRVKPEYEKATIQPNTAMAMVGRYNYQGSPYLLAYIKEKFWLNTGSFLPAELTPVGDNRFICRGLGLEVEFTPAKLGFKKPWATRVHPDELANQMADSEKLPIEWIREGKFERALAEYQQLKKDHPDAPAVNEQRLNTLGYQLLGIKKIDNAIEVFRINMILYPKAFNTWDSLGEAYMNKGESELAIESYQKSLELNPGNTGAADMIEKIKAEAAGK
jgi:tetratricopeptide (TPR) repeat protein